MNNKKPLSLKIKIIICLLAVIIGFTLVYFLYDSPAQYVTKPDGTIFLKPSNGEPILYYKDLFGNKFYQIDGKRVYAIVPDTADDAPIYDPVEQSTNDSNN